MVKPGGRAGGEFCPGGQGKSSQKEKHLSRVLKDQQTERQWKSITGMELAGAKALGHERAGYVVCLANSLVGRPHQWSNWKEMMLIR